MNKSQYYTLLDTIKLTLDVVPLLTEKENMQNEDINRTATEITLSALNKLNVLLCLAYTEDLDEIKRKYNHE